MGDRLANGDFPAKGMIGSGWMEGVDRGWRQLIMQSSTWVGERGSSLLDGRKFSLG